MPARRLLGKLIPLALVTACGGGGTNKSADAGEEVDAEVPELDLRPGSFLPPVVQQQRLQGVRDHMHIDEVRLRDDDLLFYCSYTFGAIDAANPRDMEYVVQDLRPTIPDTSRPPGCIHLSWDDTDYDIIYTTHRGNIRNPAYLGGWDISDPEVPLQLPVLQEEGAHYEGVDVLNGYLYVGLRSEGLGVYTRNPGDNTLGRIATLPGFQRAWGVRARADGTVFVTDADAGLVSVDVSTPEDPAIVGQVATGGTARDVVLAGNFAYVAAGSGGVVVVDVTDLTDMQVVTRIEMRGSAIRVAHSEDLLYVAAWNDARVYDVADPTSPRFIGAARLTHQDDDIADPDRPQQTQRIFGVAARGTDMFLGSWWVPHSYKVFPERTAPRIRLPETYTLVDFGSVTGQATQSFPVTNEGTEPLTLVYNFTIGDAYAVHPRQMRLAPGETGDLDISFNPTGSETEVGYLKLLSDDPAEPLRAAYLAGNLPGLTLGESLPETNAILVDGTEWSSSQVEDKVLLLAYFATF